MVYQLPQRIIKNIWLNYCSALMQSMVISIQSEMFYFHTILVYLVLIILTTSKMQDFGLNKALRKQDSISFFRHAWLFLIILNGADIMKLSVKKIAIFNNMERLLLKDFKMCQMEKLEEHLVQLNTLWEMVLLDMVRIKGQHWWTILKISLSITSKDTEELLTPQSEMLWYHTVQLTLYQIHSIQCSWWEF